MLIAMIKDRSVVVAVVSLVVANRVGVLGDIARQAALRQLRLELLADPRLLVGVGDRLLTEDALVVSAEAARRPERDVVSVAFADIEVLVIPLLGRREDRAFAPGDDLLFALRRPDDRIAFARGYDDDAPGAMAMSELVPARREHRHVSGFPRARAKSEGRAAGATRRVRDELVPGSHVREEVAH